MLYAIITNGSNAVVDVINADNPPQYPPTISGLTFYAVECSDNVHVNMVYNTDTGEFAEPATPEPESTPEIYQESELMSEYTKGVESVG